MRPQNLAQLKRYLQVGMSLTLVDFNNGESHPGLNIPRKIKQALSNQIQFDNGSWLGLGATGERASDYTFTSEGFTYDGGWVKMTYKYNS